MAKIRKSDLNREARRKAVKGFHMNIYTKKYKSYKDRIRAIRLAKGIYHA